MFDDKDQRREQMAGSGRCIRKERGYRGECHRNSCGLAFISKQWSLSVELSDRNSQREQERVLRRAYCNDSLDLFVFEFIWDASCLACNETPLRRGAMTRIGGDQHTALQNLRFPVHLLCSLFLFAPYLNQLSWIASRLTSLRRYDRYIAIRRDVDHDCASTRSRQPTQYRESARCRKRLPSQCIQPCLWSLRIE